MSKLGDSVTQMDSGNHPIENS